MARLRARKPKTGDHKWLITAGIWVGVAASVIGLIWSQNNVVTVDDIMLESTVIPKSLNGTKLVHISDLNNTHLDIYNKVQKLNPDLIVLSGGYCDANGNYDNTYNTVDNLTSIAPVYYVYNAEDNEVGEVLEGTSAINITNGSIKIKNEREIDEYIKETYGDSFYSKYQAGDEQYVDYVEYIEHAIDESLDAEIRLIGIDSHTEENGARQALDELNGVLDRKRDI